MRTVSANNRSHDTQCPHLPWRAVPGIPNIQYLVSIGYWVFIVGLLTACTMVRVTRPVVKIGLVGPFEGPYRYVGYDAIYAAQLALQEANAAGGSGNYSVELVAYDDQGDVAGARVAAHNLVQDPRVIAVIGHYRNGTTEAARTIYEQAGLPLVVAGTLKGEASGYADMVCGVVDHWMQQEAEALGGNLRVQMFGDRSSDWLDALACAEGVSITVGEEVPPPPGVGAVLLALDPLAAGETLLALREAGWQGLVAGGPTLGSPLFSQVAGEEAIGVLFASPYRWPEVEDGDAGFRAAYRSVGPHVPPPGPFALTTYQAVETLLTAIETTTRQGEAPIRETIAPNLPPTSTPAIYLYRWTPSRTLEQLSQYPISNP